MRTVSLRTPRKLRMAVASGFNVARGMMFRSFRKLGVDGMLFTMPFAARWSFWTPFCEPMDIVFLNEQRKILEIAHMRPWKIYKPDVNFSYALELRAGLRKFFKEGKTVAWSLR